MVIPPGPYSIKYFAGSIEDLDDNIRMWLPKISELCCKNVAKG